MVLLKIILMLIMPMLSETQESNLLRPILRPILLLILLPSDLTLMFYLSLYSKLGINIHAVFCPSSTGGLPPLMDSSHVSLSSYSCLAAPAPWQVTEPHGGVREEALPAFVAFCDFPK